MPDRQPCADIHQCKDGGPFDGQNSKSHERDFELCQGGSLREVTCAARQYSGVPPLQPDLDLVL
jgi:hypothetical protein